MDKKEYLEDISEIKNLMNKSSQFNSLSGLSSFYTGIYGIIGAAYYYIKEIQTNSYSPQIAAIIFVTITMLSVITTIYFTKKNAKRSKIKAWNISTNQLVTTYSITFVVGSFYIFILLLQEKYQELIPLIPLVYGLSLIHTARHTKNIIKPLAVAQIITAFLCLLFIKQSFWFYLINFGFIHLINGIIIYFGYDKKQIL